MARRRSDATLWSVEQMLEDALNEVRSGRRPRANKAMVLFLGDEKGCYNTGFSQAGMSMHECVALCEVAKIMFLEEMGHVNQDAPI